MEKGQRTRLASLGVLALVFTSGGLVGMALDRAAAADVSATVPAGAGQEEGRDGERRRPRMYERVGLSAADLLAADSLVRLHRESYRQLNRAYRRDVDSIVAVTGRDLAFRREADSLVAELRQKVRGLMTAEQERMYDSLVVENDRRRAEREERSGDPGN